MLVHIRSNVSEPREGLKYVIHAVNFINIYARVFRTKFWRQSQNVIRKAAEKDIRTKKARKKMLMNLTHGRPKV